MKNDDVLAALRAAHEEAKAEEREDERWNARQRGELTAEEEAELGAAALGDPRARCMLERTNPPAEDLAARIAARALAAHGHAAVRDAGDAGSQSRAGDRAASQSRDGVVVPLNRQRRRATVIASLAAAIAAAAAVALWMRAPPPEANLPEYALLVDGTDRATRGTSEDADTDVRLTLSRGGYVDIVARPARAVTEPMEARAFLVRAGVARAVGGNLTVNEAGTVHLEGPAATLFGDAAGVWELVIVVGPRGALPASGAEASELPRESTRTRRVLRRSIDLRG